MKNNTVSRLIRLIICLVVVIVIVGIGAATGFISLKEFTKININGVAIVKVIVVTFAIIAIEALLSLLLGLPKPKNHRIRSMLSITSSLLKYVAIIVIICWGLSILGVNIATIVASVGIFALIVGFSAESLIADVVTGAFIIFENQYNVGDIVETDGFRGTVTNIGIRTTSITDVGGNVKIVNNSDMKNILNRSNKVSLSVSEIGIPYPTDLEKLEAAIPALMKRIHEAHPDVILAPPTYLGVQALADSAVVLRFTADVEEQNIYAGARILNHDLLLGFRKLCVECPFPQIDVHNN